MANRPFASVRNLVEAGENLGAYIADPARRAEALRATGAYRLPNASAARTRERVLGAGTFGEVALESFPPAVPAAAAAGPVGIGPTVAVKKTLRDDDFRSVCAETAALRYFVGVPNITQLIGMSSTAAAGNAVATTLPRIITAPAKSSLADLLKGPTAKHATATNTANASALISEWGNLYPYTVERGGYVPARDSDAPRNSANRDNILIRIATASAAASGINVSRPILARSWANLKSICMQILRGYHAMHSWGVVHRDTKPQNILVTHYGEVQITDFGQSRYQTQYLDPIMDTYTGTIWYASPEVLMAQWLSTNRREHYRLSQEDWKAHDAWAVGAVLYHVLTRDPLFYGNSTDEMLDRIFGIKGCPVAEDGFVFDQFPVLPFADRIRAYVRDNNAIINRILTRAITISPDYDPSRPGTTDSELLQLARVISGLLTYNPTRRLTIEQALQSPLFGGAPTMPPRPFISVPYSTPILNQEGLVPTDVAINNRMLNILDSWLMEIATRYVIRSSAPFVLDRAFTYYRRFYQYYTTEGRAKILAAQGAGEHLLSRVHLQGIGIVAFLITDNLLNSKPGFTFDIAHARYLTSDTYTITTLKKIYDLFIEGNIPFLGRTYFDELLAADPVLPTLGGVDQENRICALGVLSGYCNTAEIYYEFRDDLPRLYSAMTTYTTTQIAELGLYFNREGGRNTYRSVDGAIKPIFTAFRESLTAAAAPAAAAPARVEGGRRFLRSRRLRSKRQQSRRRR